MPLEELLAAHLFDGIEVVEEHLGGVLIGGAILRGEGDDLLFHDFQGGVHVFVKVFEHSDRHDELL